MAQVTLPDKISDLLKKWCIEVRHRPDYYKSGMSAEDMLSFVSSATGLGETEDRLATMREVLDDDNEPTSWQAIKFYAQKFVARENGVEFTDVFVEPAETKDEETPTASGAVGAGAGAGSGGQRRMSATRGRAASFRQEAAKPAEAAQGAAGRSTESEDAEVARFTKLYNDYMELDFNKNKVKRTGWTKIPASYKIACCGNSKQDMCYILMCFLTLYVSIALIFYGLLEAYLATQKGQELLYINVALLILAWVTLALVVQAGNRARAKEEAEHEAAKAEA